MPEQMWAHQGSLPLMNLSVDVNLIEEFARLLPETKPRVQAEVTKAIWAFADRMFAGITERIGNHDGEGTVLHVRERGLRGGLVEIKTSLMAVLEDDVFYGALWEEGIPGFLAYGRWPKPQAARPWWAPSFEQAGGEAGFYRDVDAAFGRGAHL